MARLVFECEDSEGYRVLFETTEKEGKELVASYALCKQWLLENGFRLAQAPGRKPKGSEKVRFDGQHCPRCDGAVWDNRAQKQEDPAKRKRPDFSCKDRERCGWAVWPGQYEIVEDTA